MGSVGPVGYRMVSKLIHGWRTEALALTQSLAESKCGFNQQQDKGREREGKEEVRHAQYVTVCERDSCTALLLGNN